MAEPDARVGAEKLTLAVGTTVAQRVAHRRDQLV